MDERNEWLAERFEGHRTHLRSVAYRILGSASDADDATQEAWLRLNRSDAAAIDNLGGWLTTVVARIALDMLRARTTRREDAFADDSPEPVAGSADGGDPEREALLADAIAPAMLLVLEALAPAERVAFVLHDVFGVPFEEIAPVVGRTPVAARQLASRARRRVRGTATTTVDEFVNIGMAGRDRQREVVRAFFAASRGGDFTALLALLDPDVVVRADAAAVGLGAAAEVHGAMLIRETHVGRATAARLALVDGVAGAFWAPDGTPKVVFHFTIAGDRVTAIDLIADPARIAAMDIVVLDD